MLAMLHTQHNPEPQIFLFVTQVAPAKQKSLQAYNHIYTPESPYSRE